MPDCELSNSTLASYLAKHRPSGVRLELSAKRFRFRFIFRLLQSLNLNRLAAGRLSHQAVTQENVLIHAPGGGMAEVKLGGELP